MSAAEECGQPKPTEDEVTNVVSDLILHLAEQVDEWRGKKNFEKDYGIVYSEWVRDALGEAFEICKRELDDFQSQFEGNISGALDEREDDIFGEYDC
tara:strand:- start:3761 stop:4051 length:291 start_codon:yes stop_codon:yes gene_type:complete